jgi:hypothetical protein
LDKVIFPSDEYPRGVSWQKGAGLIPGSKEVGKGMFNWSGAVFEALNNFLTLLFFYVFVRRFIGLQVCFLQPLPAESGTRQIQVNVADTPDSADTNRRMV